MLLTPCWAAHPCGDDGHLGPYDVLGIPVRLWAAATHLHISPLVLVVSAPLLFPCDSRAVYSRMAPGQAGEGGGGAQGGRVGGRQLGQVWAS